MDDILEQFDDMIELVVQAETSDEWITASDAIHEFREKLETLVKRSYENHQ